MPRSTKHVGHIRDVRRLVVSLSRARLGLLVFADRALYEPCAELRPALSQLLALPDRLRLLPHERFPTARLVRSAAPPAGPRADRRAAPAYRPARPPPPAARARQASEPAPAPLEVLDAEHMMSLVAEMAFESRRLAELAYSTAPEEAAADVADEGAGALASKAKRPRLEADSGGAGGGEAAEDDGAAPERDLDTAA